MEILIYLGDVMLVLLLLYWCVGQSRRRAGAPSTGLFRYRETPPPPPRQGRPESRHASRHTSRHASRHVSAHAGRPPPRRSG